MMQPRAKAKSYRSAIAAGIYLLLLAGLVGWGYAAFASVKESYAALNAAEKLLQQIEGRGLPAGMAAATGFGGGPGGSPFLEGESVTVAGAALLQRIASAVTTAGGNVLSSQVELEKADAKDGWLGLVVSCELEQTALQPLLYDLEAGMPFLFIDQLTITAPVTGVEQSRMRVLLSVSGQWAGGKG